MAYIKLQDGIVVQKQPHPDTGFIEAPDWVVCGMVQDGKTYVVPAKPLAQRKDEKITELRLACRDHIFNGFDSDALGTVQHYSLSETDQSNLLLAYSAAQDNASVTGWTTDVQCVDSNGVVDYRSHTAAQVKTVANCIKTKKDAAFANLQAKLGQVNAATTEATLEAIAW